MWDGNVNPSKINFKSDISEVKKRKSKIKMKISSNCNPKWWFLFLSKRKNYWFFRDYLLLGSQNINF